MSTTNPKSLKKIAQEKNPLEDITLIPYTLGATLWVDFHIWDALRQSSLEVAVTRSEDLEHWQFASNECLYFARIDCHSHLSESTSSSSSSSASFPCSKCQGLRPGIGLVYLTPSQFDGELNLGICLEVEKRGAGRARMALNKLLKWVFEDARYHRVQAAIMDGPNRHAAMNLFVNLGFSHEGIRRRQVYRRQSQRWIDVTYMAILDTDWIVQDIRHDRPQKNWWDDLFERQQREREELLELEARHGKMKTKSMETIKAYSPSRSVFDQWVEEAVNEVVDEEPAISALTRGRDPEDIPLGDIRPQRIAALSQRSEWPLRHTEEDRGTMGDDDVQSDRHSDASDMVIEDNMSPPPESEYPESISGSSFAEIDKDFEDNISERSSKSWDRCSGIESV